MNITETKPLKVLVVDDDPATLRLIVRIVSRAGHRVSQADNGSQALQSILSESPDLVICDWDMPEMDGVELCRRIRHEELPHYVYFLLLTARSDADDMVEGLDAGADDFVSKPINRAILIARIEAGSRVLHMERKLRTMSEHDSLTGLLNRRAFYDRFTLESERAGRYHRPLSCVLMDLDLFKRINDAHGHAAGDATLHAVARLLANQCRSIEVLCRYGGEEFCAVLPETNEADAAQWAERVRKAIAELTIPFGELAIQATASFGVAERLADAAGPEEVVELADEALAVAKQSGRNRVVRFTSLQVPGPEFSHKLRFEDPLSDAIARDVMSAIVLCPQQQDTVRDVADLFLQLRINSAPVVNDADAVVGIVTEADLMTRTAFGKGWDATMQEVMRTDVVCYREETPLREVYQFLSRVSVPRVVIVDRERPTGVISRATLLRWFRNWMCMHAGPPGDCWDEERERRKQGIIKTAKAVARQAEEIPLRIEGEDQDFIPCVLGEATRIQDLTNELLGQCRSSQVP